MRFISVCSGIESASVAWGPLGWQALAFSEIEPFPCAVLAHHYPKVPNLGDFTKADWRPYHEAVDLVVAGTPCQDFSVAGLRAGLAGTRGNLTLEFLRVLNEARPRWVVWENVPGVLSVNGGRAFGVFLGGLAQLGYGFAYRVLDAQYFGVAQRRRRVFVVGYLGDWRAAAAVLFEREGLCGHPAPRREAGQGFAADASGSSHWSGGPHPSLNQSHNTGGVGQSNQKLFSQQGAYLVPGDPHCITGPITHTLKAEGFDASEDGTGRGQPIDTTGPLLANGKSAGSATQQDAEQNTLLAVSVALRGREGGGACELGDDKAHALRASQGGADKPHVLSGTADTLTSHWHNSNGAKAGNNSGVVNPVMVGMQVRRLTPRECERLQGFPDDYTLIPYPKPKWVSKYPERVKYAADGPRYKALGNSKAVTVVRWIGRRIEAVEKILTDRGRDLPLLGVGG